MKTVVALVDDRTGTDLASFNAIGINQSINISKYPTATRIRVRIYRDLENVEVSGTCYPVISNSPVDAYVPCDSNALVIPDEVLSLEGYGEGINADYYNFVDLVSKKYTKAVKRIVFNGTEAWRKTDGVPRFDFILSEEAVSSKHIQNYYDTNIGITIENNQLGFRIYKSTDGLSHASVRPEDYETLTLAMWKSRLADWAAEGKPFTVVFALATPESTDISDLITDDNFIEVTENGTIIAENLQQSAVPTTITYQLKGVTV